MATHRIETSGVHAAECSVSHPKALLAQFARRLAMALGFSVSMILVAPCVASAQPFLFRGWVLSEFQPDIANGGRANTIAVNPTKNSIILVASESGGLFRSTDGGTTWHHVDSLPQFWTNAVTFMPADPNVGIVTTSEDFATSNGGGL